MVKVYQGRDGDRYAYYPECCTSAACGGSGDDCLTCDRRDILAEFKKWVADNNAVKLDPVWSPGCYTAQG